MALHVMYRFKAEKTIYRMVYNTYRLYRFLGFKSICTAQFAKILVWQRANCTVDCQQACPGSLTVYLAVKLVPFVTSFTMPPDDGLHMGPKHVEAWSSNKMKKECIVLVNCINVIRATRPTKRKNICASRKWSVRFAVEGTINGGLSQKIFKAL
jgi:hypothetical protein